MNQKGKMLTIGQFAALHGINKKTLMWYDETDLFSPAFVSPENGYRYYNYYQSPALETILLMRGLGVSLPEIRDFMQNRSAEKMERLLGEKIAGLDAQIRRLKAVRNTLLDRQKEVQALLDADLSEISLVEKEACCLVTIDIDRHTAFEKEVELILAETERYGLGRLHDASYGSMIPVESLLSGDFDNYAKLFIEIPLLKQKKGLHLQPKGAYLKAFHKGSWNTLPRRYQEILDYAKENKLKLSGFSYEKGLNEMVIDRIEDYIAQIEIPVLKAYEEQPANTDFL